MTPELRAASKTLGIVLMSLIGVGVTIGTIELFGPAVAGIVFCFGVLVYLLRMVYLIELNTQQTLDKLNKM